MVAEPCRASPRLHHRMQASGDIKPEACNHQPMSAKCCEVLPVLARMFNLALSKCPNSQEL